MDRGAWRATVHGVAKSLTQLSNFHFTLGATQALAPPESIGEITDKRKTVWAWGGGDSSEEIRPQTPGAKWGSSRSGGHRGNSLKLALCHL